MGVVLRLRERRWASRNDEDALPLLLGAGVGTIPAMYRVVSYRALALALAETVGQAALSSLRRDLSLMASTSTSEEAALLDAVTQNPIQATAALGWEAEPTHRTGWWHKKILNGYRL